MTSVPTYALFAAMIATAFLLWRRAKKIAAAQAPNDASDVTHG